MNSNDFNDDLFSIPTVESLDGAEKINPSGIKVSLLPHETIKHSTASAENNIDESLQVSPQDKKFNPRSGETPFGSGYSDVLKSKTNFLDMTYNDESLKLTHRGEITVKIIAALVIVISLFELYSVFQTSEDGSKIFVYNVVDFFSSAAQKGFTLLFVLLRILASMKMVGGSLLARIYVGVVMIVRALVYFGTVFNLGAVFYATSAVGIFRYICLAISLVFAYMAFLLFLSKSVKAFFKRFD